MIQNIDYRTPRDRIGSELMDKAASEAFAEKKIFSQTAPAKCRIGQPDSLRESSRPLAMIYAPEDSFDDIYDDETGLSRGTIFKNLDFPFEAYLCGVKNPMGRSGRGGCR